MKVAWLAFLLALPLAAQTQTVCGPDPGADKDKTLGEFAREHRNPNASHAKYVLNDDTVTPKSPLPDIALEDNINDAEITAAFKDYEFTHSRAEIEHTVHEWYDNQVALYNQLRDDVAHIQSAQAGGYGYGYNYYNSYPYSTNNGGDTDPGKLREQQALAQAGMQADQRTTQRDNQQMTRITGALSRLRIVFDPKYSRYNWFNTNLYQQRY